MDAPSPNNTLLHCFSTVAESNGSTAQPSASSANDGQTCRKRKASPGDETPRKRAKVSDSEPQGSSEKNLKMSAVLRKMRKEDSGRGSDGCMSQQSAPSAGQRKRKASPDERSPRKRAKGSDSEPPSTSKNKLRTSALLMGLRKLISDTKESPTTSKVTNRADFEAKYEQQNQLGEGGFGCVYGGYRKADNLPVAIKHIAKENVLCKHTDKSGKELPTEVAIMLKLAVKNSHSKGASAPVALLDWYDVDQELILVLERPVPALDLLEYMNDNEDSLSEEKAKIILKQLVDAANYLEEEHIFHRDMKLENVLIETGSDVPVVRVIDFGLSCFSREGSSYSLFFGTKEHIPPEWHRCGNYAPGPTSVWQVGVILYEILHNKLFDTIQFMNKNLRISEILSDDCQDFLRACLADYPERRLTLKQLRQHPWLQ